MCNVIKLQSICNNTTLCCINKTDLIKQLTRVIYDNYPGEVIHTFNYSRV